MKRLVILVTVSCLLISTAMPVLAADPLDPAGNPLDADRSTDPEDSVSQEVTQQAHATFQRGDIFVAVSNGRVQWHLPDGTLNKVLDTGEGGFTTGMAFDDRGHLFLTGFQTNKIYEFDPEGNLVGTFASLNGTTDCQPESIVFDAAGNMYVGQAGCSDDVLKFAPDGTMLARYNVAVEDRGSDWIDLEPDQCTLRYTSEGQRVLRYDVCEDVQLGDWGAGLTTSYALRLLPDDPFNPDLLVASTQNIRRMHLGLSTTGYDAPGEDCWFALNLDPDATTFWSADFCSSNVYRFDIASSNVVSSFDTGTGASTVFGLAVFGELSTGTVRDCSSEDLSGAFGEVLPDTGERTTVRYDARFLVDETRDLFAAEARAIAEKIQGRAEHALDLYGADGVANQAGLGFVLPETLRIEISCSINFGPIPIDPVPNGFVGEPGVIQLRLDFVQNELIADAIAGFLPGGDWAADGAPWKNLIDHEVFHTVQYEYESLVGRFIGGDQTLIESPAMLAQDLFPEVDNLAPGGLGGDEYLESVLRLAQLRPTIDVDNHGVQAKYDAPSVFQYWGERFGPAAQGDLERRVADFLKILIDEAGPQTRAYADAIGGDARAALRDYYLAHYGLRATNISAAENARYAILDAENGPAYEPLRLRPDLDISSGATDGTARTEPWAGDVYEIVNIPDDATHIALRLDTGFSGLLNHGFVSAIVPINPGNEFIVDPQLMPAGPNVFRPIEQRIPIVGRDRLAIVFVNGNTEPVDFIVSAEAVSGAVGMQFVDPTGADPHRIQSATAEPILLEVVPALDGQPMPGDLPRSAFHVEIGGLAALVSTADYRSGEYHLTVWAPRSLDAGTYPMTLTFAETEFAVPGGLVIEQDAPPPTQILRSDSLGNLGQGESASADALVTPGAQVATFEVAWTGSDFDLSLTSPSGRVIGENSSDPDVTVSETATSVRIDVAGPEGGAWHLDVLGTDVPSPEPVSYEVSETGAPLFGELFVADEGEAGLPLDATFAWSEPDGAVISGEVIATVTDPIGTTRRFPLHDDGANGDSGNADGVYGARLWATDIAGTYQIVVTASGMADGGAPVQRQASTVITLGPRVDTDGDGVADDAEPLFAGDPADPSDGASDHDGDGLGLAEELAAGTDPAAWDTEDGGENDPSELAAGRDPRDPADDADVEDVLLGAVPLDGRLVRVEARTVGGTGSVRVYRLTGGVRTDLGLHPGSGVTISDGPLTAGEYSYLAVAVSDAGVESGPFVAGPVTVANDVTPPDFRIHLNGGRWQVTDPEVSVTFTDLTEAVEEMRLATSEAELSNAAWMPFSGFSSVTIPAGLGQHFVYAQVRDAAGNESAVRAGFVFRVDRNPPESQAGPLDATYTTGTALVPYTANDDLSGVATVELWWRYRPDDTSGWSDWSLGPTGTTSPIEFTFGSGDGLYEFYSIAVDAAGNREMAPEVADAATQRISDAGWSASVRINDDQGAQTQQERPAVVIGADGAAYAVWDDMRIGNQTDIFFSRLDPTTGQWSANQKVNNDSTTRAQWRASIAVDGSNTAYAVWQDSREGSGSGDANIYFSKRAASSGAWGANLRVNDDRKAVTQTSPHIAVNAAGDAIAVWVDRRSSQWNIYSSRLPAGASAWTANMRVTDNTSSRKDAPRVAIAADGSAYAVWEDDRSGNWDVWVSRLPAGSSTWNPNAKLSDDPGSAAQYTPGVGIDATGNVLAVWLDDRAPDTEVRSRRLSAGGTVWDPSLVASDTSSYLPSNLSLSVAPSGDALAAWADGRSGNWDIWSAAYSAGSLAWGSFTLVSDDPTTSHQLRPAAASRGNTAVVLWFDARESYLGDIRASVR